MPALAELFAGEIQSARRISAAQSCRTGAAKIKTLRSALRLAAATRPSAAKPAESTAACRWSHSALLHAVAKHRAELVHLTALRGIGTIQSRLTGLLPLTISHVSPAATIAATPLTASLIPVGLPLLLPLLHLIDHIIQPLLLIGWRHGEELVHSLGRFLTELTLIALKEFPPLIFAHAVQLLPKLITKTLAIGFWRASHLIAQLLQFGERRIGPVKITQRPSRSNANDQNGDDANRYFTLIHYLSSHVATASIRHSRGRAKLVVIHR
jgi:hypothetical protein